MPDNGPADLSGAHPTTERLSAQYTREVEQSTQRVATWIKGGKMSSSFGNLAGNQNLLYDFFTRGKAMHAPKVLELGAKRSLASRSTIHKHWFPNAAVFHGSDIEPGEDVDVIADVHNLSNIVGPESYDIIISCSTFEHFKYPHLASTEIMKSLKISGVIFVQTHQTYHIHSYPSDYFRYTREGLSALFPKTMGFEVISTCYNFPAEIHSDRVPWQAANNAFLNVCLFGEKLDKTPAVFVPDVNTAGQ